MKYWWKQIIFALLICIFIGMLPGKSVQAATTYKVTFNANGGKVSPTYKKVKKKKKIGTMPTPTKNGFTFKGWYSKKSGGTKRKTSFVIKKKQTLYAHWTANTYSVAFDANGGTLSAAPKSITFNKAYGSLPSPAKTGYSFAGWYTNVTGGTLIKSTTKVATAGNHTLYAHWTANVYKVNFLPNGGEVTVKEKSITYEQTFGSLPTPTRTGYTFTGWYTDSEAGSQITASSPVNMTNDVSLYAHWKINQYKVSFNSNGADKTFDSRTVTYNNAVGTLPMVERKGYTFDGWYTKATGGTKYESNTLVTGNVTLYAHWTAIVYTIHYDGNEKTGGSMTDVTFTLDDIPALADNKFTMKNATFAGWSTKKNGQAEYQPGNRPITVANIDSIMDSTGKWTLYAVWSGKTSTTSFYDSCFTSYLTGEEEWSKFEQAAQSVNKDKCILVPGYKYTNVGTVGKVDPYASTGYIPQGICQTDKYILITAYDINGLYGSVIYVLDLKGNYKTTILLDTQSHMGGITYLADSKEICFTEHEVGGVYLFSAKKLDDLVAQGKDQVSMSVATDAKHIAINEIPAFVTYYNGSIYAGVFMEKFDPEVPNNLIRLDYVNNEWKEQTINVALPAQTQGLSFVEYKGKTYMICSCSYGRKNASRMYIYEVDCANEEDWICTVNYDADPYLVFPNMSEGIFFSGQDDLYTCFESCANYYQYKSGKTTKHTVGKDIFPIDRVTVNSFTGLMNTLYPAETGATITLSEIDDILGVVDEAHEHDFIFEETVEPTCGSFGFDVYGCVCGEKDYRNPVDTHGKHSFKELSEDEEGRELECTKCGYYYVEGK